jgi:hypothetical protein
MQANANATNKIAAGYRLGDALATAQIRHPTQTLGEILDDAVLQHTLFLDEMSDQDLIQAVNAL